MSDPADTSENHKVGAKANPVTNSRAHGTKTVALTGLTGFLGGYAASELHKKGWKIRALVRRQPNLPTELMNAGIELVHGDLSNQRALDDLCRGADAVLHMAGQIKGAPGKGFDDVNVGGTERLAASWQTHCPNAPFLLVSSLAAREPSLSSYATTKRAGEEALIKAAGDHGRWLVVRPGAIYGPGDKETLKIFQLADAPLQILLGGADARVTLIHAQDVARAIAALLESDATAEIFELADGNIAGYSWPEVGHLACAALGRTPRMICLPPALLRFIARTGELVGKFGLRTDLPTIEKTREILHPDWSSQPSAQPDPKIWTPAIDARIGFAQTIESYRKNGDLK